MKTSSHLTRRLALWTTFVLACAGLGACGGGSSAASGGSGGGGTGGAGGGTVTVTGVKLPSQVSAVTAN